eukprot:gene13776-biopygen3128
MQFLQKGMPRADMSRSKRSPEGAAEGFGGAVEHGPATRTAVAGFQGKCGRHPEETAENPRRTAPFTFAEMAPPAREDLSSWLEQAMPGIANGSAITCRAPLRLDVALHASERARRPEFPGWGEPWKPRRPALSQQGARGVRAARERERRAPAACDESLHGVCIHGVRRRGVRRH